MCPDVSVGPLKAEPGKKLTSYVTVSRRYDGTPIQLPVALIAGREAGPILSVDACVHGDEPEGTLAVIQLINDLDPMTMRGAVIATPIFNASAFELCQRVVGSLYQYPIAEDLDRAFPGRPNGSLTQRFAHVFFTEIASKADYVISLHSGGNSLYNTQRVITQSELSTSLDLAKAMGEEWPIIMEGHYATGTLDKLLLEKKTPVVAPELGGSAGRLPDTLNANARSMKNGVINAMKSIGMVEGIVTRPASWIVVDGSGYDLRSDTGGLLMPSENCRLGKRLPTGVTLATITDPFGRSTEDIASPYDGIVLGFRTNPVVTPGDTVVMYGKVLRTIQ